VAARLSVQLFELLKRPGLPGATSDALEDLIDSLENLRTLLNRRFDARDSDRLGQWVLVSFDLLDALKESISDWLQRSPNIVSVSIERSGIPSIKERIQTHFDSLKQALDSSPNDSPETWTDVSSLIHSIDGRAFWSNSFGSSTFHISAPGFRSKLSLAFSNLSDSDITDIMKLLDASSLGVVSILKWDCFLDTFGDRIEDALNAFKLFRRKGYFAGYISHSRGVELLRGCAQGAFLVRFAINVPANLVILSQQNSGDEGIVEIPVISRKGLHRIDGSEEFLSLGDLIESHSPQCQFPAPTLHPNAQASVFRQSLSREETEKLLVNEPVGTYLFRSSASMPGALILARKGRSGVNQALVIAQDGAYVIKGPDKTRYQSIDDIVARNRSRLRYPYVKVPTEPARHDMYGFVDDLL